jgi:hypothetical protein
MKVTWLVLVLLALTSNLTRAQSCNPAVVSYIVRDENAQVLSAAELNTLYEQLPEASGAAHSYVSEVSFKDDGKTYYWPESADWEQGRKVTSLGFANAEACAMTLTEVTLTYHDKQMRLIFNLDITRTQPDRRLVIDALPFQAGTFELDLRGWSRRRDEMIPAERWKKVSSDDRAIRNGVLKP